MDGWVGVHVVSVYLCSYMWFMSVDGGWVHSCALCVCVHTCGLCVYIGVAGWGACLCCLLACVHACSLCVWMGMYASMWYHYAFVDTCGLCVRMVGGGGGVHTYSVCECPYMRFMYVDGWMCACMNRFGYMCVYAY